MSKIEFRKRPELREFLESNDHGFLIEFEKKNEEEIILAKQFNMFLM